MRFFLILLTIVGGAFILFACSNEEKIKPKDSIPDLFNDPELVSINEEVTPNLIIREGIICPKAQSIRVLRKGNPIAVINLGEPSVVVQAEEKEDWGYYQFPILYYSDKGEGIIVEWQMKADSYTAYGSDGRGRLISYDEGLTWKYLDKDYLIKDRYRVELKNGSILQVKTPASKPKTEYSNFPKALGETIKDYDFYYERDMPEELRGAYLEICTDGMVKTIHASINDPGLLRFTIDGYAPIVWWGNIKELDDGSLVAGVYPNYYMNGDGTISNSTVSFYKSSDLGSTWNIIGKIPYYEIKDGRYYSPGFYDSGFTEPAFEVLNDSTFFCVMRTGYNTPMYRALSTDKGINWSFASPFTPNGVMPNLLLLKNGTLVLSSGRPGVQLRFNIEGDGRYWTEPIDMLPFMNDGEYDVYASCGYTCIIPAKDNDSFYLVYSDFKTKNIYGENRKSILFRKVQIIKK